MADDSVAPAGRRRGRGGDGTPWWVLSKYQTFLAGATVGAVGNWMLRTAQLLLAIEVTEANGLLVGIVTAMQYAPIFIFSALVGVRADRQSKATLLLVGQIVMVGTAVLQAVLLIGGIDSWVVLALLAAGFGIGAAIDGPMRTSVLPDLVAPARVATAVSVNVVVLQLGRFLGPPLTAFLIVEASFAWAFTVAGIMLLGFAFVLPRMSVAPAPGVAARSGGLREAFAYLRRRRRILAVFALVGLGGILGPNLVTFAALIIYRDFAGTAADVAYASTALAIGALVGSLWAARTRWRSLGAVTVITALVGVSSIAVALMPSFPAFLVMLAIAGGIALAMVSQGTGLVQMLVDDDVRGRVTGLYFIVLVAGAPIGAPIVGALGDVIGIRWAIVIAGAVVTATALVIALLVRGRRRASEA